MYFIQQVVFISNEIKKKKPLLLVSTKSMSSSNSKKLTSVRVAFLYLSCTEMYMCVSKSRGQRTILGIIPQELSPLVFFWDRVSHSLGTLNILNWLASKLQGPACLYYLSAGITKAQYPRLKFLCESGVSNSGPCRAIAFFQYCLDM